MSGLLNIDEANALLDSKFGSGTPASWDIGILKTEPARDGTGYTEVSSSGTGYARVSYTNNSTNWPAASAATKRNGTLLDFGSATADWGTDMYGLGFFVSGVLKAWAEFTTPQTVLDDYPFSMPPNSIVIRA